MLPYIILGVILGIIILWFISVQRRLAMLDENINNAMSQIGVQLSSRWDALSALLDLTKGYAEHEYKTLSETIKARRPQKRHPRRSPDWRRQRRIPPRLRPEVF